jgi:RNA polymerase sigma-70 factor (ECF subfamily)
MATIGTTPDGGEMVERARGGFDTTQWGLVARADATVTADRMAALEELCRTYWFPIYCFARRQCGSRYDAEDLTQGFFADLLAKGVLAHADVARGRFRTFLLCSFVNYRGHERERAGAIKRGGGVQIVSLEALRESEDRGEVEPSAPEDAEQMYDRKWAMSLIERALSIVRAEYAAAGKAELFDVLKTVVWGDDTAPDYATIAARVGKGEGAIKVAMLRLRRRLGLVIRAEVAKTVADPAAIDDEMKHLLAAVTRHPAPLGAVF